MQQLNKSCEADTTQRVMSGHVATLALYREEKNNINITSACFQLSVFFDGIIDGAREVQRPGDGDIAVPLAAK